MREGTVVSVNSDGITWKSSNNLIIDKPEDLEIVVMGSNRVRIVRDWNAYRYYKAINRRRSDGPNNLKSKLKRKKRKMSKSAIKSIIDRALGGGV